MAPHSPHGGISRVSAGFGRFPCGNRPASNAWRFNRFAHGNRRRSAAPAHGVTCHPTAAGAAKRRSSQRSATAVYPAARVGSRPAFGQLKGTQGGNARTAAKRKKPAKAPARPYTGRDNPQAVRGPADAPGSTWATHGPLWQWGNGATAYAGTSAITGLRQRDSARERSMRNPQQCQLRAEPASRTH